MRSLFALAFLFLSCTTAAPSPQREIRAQYDRLERAFESRDIPTILSIRDPRLEVIGPNGQHDDYAHMAEYTRQWFETNKSPIKSRFTLESFDMLPNGDVAVHTLQYASRYQERDGKLRKVEHEVRQRETWTHTPKGWLMIKVDDIDLAHRKRWIDGKLEGQ